MCTAWEIALYSLCLVLTYYWFCYLSQNILKYNSSRNWSENAFIESCLLFIHNTFYQVPYLLYVVLDTIKIDPIIYLTGYFVLIVFSLVIFFLFLLIKLRAKRHPNQPNNAANYMEIKSDTEKKEDQVSKNTNDNSLLCESQLVQEYRSIESALLDIIIIISMFISILNISCVRMQTGFLYGFPDLLYLTHLGFLVKKRLFRTDITYIYWIGYVCFVLVAWNITITFYKCSLRLLVLELYSNVWIIYLTTAFAACRKFDRGFVRDLQFLGKFVVFFGIICLINSILVNKQKIVEFLIASA